MEKAFEEVVLAMFDYMTDLDAVGIDASQAKEIEAEGACAAPGAHVSVGAASSTQH